MHKRRNGYDWLSTRRISPLKASRDPQYVLEYDDA